MITVKQLIEELRTYDPDARVRLATDEEGNYYAEFLEIQVDKNYIYLHPDGTTLVAWNDIDDEGNVM